MNRRGFFALVGGVWVALRGREEVSERGFVEFLERKWRGNVHVPYSYSLVETRVSDMADEIFMYDPSTSPLAVLAKNAKKVKVPAYKFEWDDDELYPR